MSFLVFLCFAITVGASGYAAAQESETADKKVPVTASSGDPAYTSTNTPYEEENTEEEGDPVTNAKRELLLDKITGLTTTLEQSDARHFFVMYANYAVINTVKRVERDVTAAAEACIKDNSGMASRVEEKLSGWKKAVSEGMKEAEANIENMSLAQTYLSQNEVKQIFKLVDETNEITDTKFKKVPVSTPEACEYMLGKMDETESTMTSLLSATMKSLPNVIQQSQE
jgi:hypothetical protein